MSRPAILRHTMSRYRMLQRRKNLAYALLIAAAVSIMSFPAHGQTIRVDTDHATNSFIPNQALGAGIDRMPAARGREVF